MRAKRVRSSSTEKEWETARAKLADINVLHHDSLLPIVSAGHHASGNIEYGMQSMNDANQIRVER